MDNNKKNSLKSDVRRIGGKKKDEEFQHTAEVVLLGSFEDISF